MAWVADSGRQKLWWFGLVWFATHASFDIGGQPKPTGKTASTVGLRFDRPPHRSQQHCALEGNCSGNMQLKVHNGMTTRRVFFKSDHKVKHRVASTVQHVCICRAIGLKGSGPKRLQGPKVTFCTHNLAPTMSVDVRRCAAYQPDSNVRRLRSVRLKVARRES